MRNRHIALFTFFGNGHVYSALGLCSELVKRGYRVTYPINDQFLALVKETGAEPLLIKDYRPANKKDVKGPFALSPMDSRWWRLIAPDMFLGLADGAKWMLSELSSFYDKDRPSLILYDRFFFAGRIVAHHLALPAIQIYSGFAHYKNLYIRENGVCHTPDELVEVGKELDSFLLDHGVRGNKSLWHTEELNIHFIPREFQYHSEYFDQRWCFVGACLKRNIVPTWENKSGGRPIILVSNTTGMEDIGYFKTIIDALSGSEYYVILSIGGRYITDEALGKLPENIEINRTASHLEILQHAALAVCQGGTGNALEPIYFGIPVIVIPYIPMHEEIAYRIAELGLGACLPGDELTVRSLRLNVSQVMGSSAIASNILEMQRAFNSAGGARLAADRIEKFLSSARYSGPDGS